MRIKHVLKFLQLLRASQISISEDEDWVRCSCPLAPFTHFKGTDENPSFGIKVNPYGQSLYNCFTCGSGVLQDLLHIMNFTTGVPVAAQDYFSLHENFEYQGERTAPDNVLYSNEFWSDKYSLSLDEVKHEILPVPDVVLQHYPRVEDGTDREAGRVRDWCIGRGIDLEVAYKYGLRYDPEGMRIVFPITDSDGKIYHLHSRSRMDKFFYYIRPDNSGYPELKWGRKDHWFGMQFYKADKPALLVESETDVLRLESLGVENSLASCGQVNKWKLDRILSNLIYLGFDSDRAGAKYCMKAIRILHSRSILARLFWRTILLRPEEYFSTGRIKHREKRAKDAGDIITSEQLDRVFAGRKFIEIGGDGHVILKDTTLENKFKEGVIGAIDRWAYSRSN